MGAPQGQLVSVVVPVLNSAEILPKLVDRVDSAFAVIDVQYEMILVNDGSTDESWSVVDDLVRDRPAVRGIDLLRNFGQHNALLAGIRAARGSVIVTIDDDLQHPPEEIPKLLDAVRDGADVVYGVEEEWAHGWTRSAASVLTRIMLSRAMGSEAARHVRAFRAFKTELRDAFGEFDGPFVSIDALLSWGTRRVGWVRVRHDERASGTSNYNVRKLIRHGLTMLTAFSTGPLRLASFVGFAFTVFGFLTLAYVLIRYLVSGSVVPGFAFLASIIAIFTGAQLFAIGVIGEYLARMHMRAMGRPSYAVRTTRGTPDAGS